MWRLRPHNLHNCETLDGKVKVRRNAAEAWPRRAPFGVRQLKVSGLGLMPTPPLLRSGAEAHPEPSRRHREAVKLRHVGTDRPPARRRNSYRASTEGSSSQEARATCRDTSADPNRKAWRRRGCAAELHRPAIARVETRAGRQNSPDRAPQDAKAPRRSFPSERYTPPATYQRRHREKESAPPAASASFRWRPRRRKSAGSRRRGSPGAVEAPTILSASRLISDVHRGLSQSWWMAQASVTDVVSSPAISIVRRFDMITSSENGLPFSSRVVTIASTKFDGFPARSGSDCKRVRASRQHLPEPRPNIDNCALDPPIRRRRDVTPGWNERKKTTTDRRQDHFEFALDDVVLPARRCWRHGRRRSTW